MNDAVGAPRFAAGPRTDGARESGTVAGTARRPSL